MSKALEGQKYTKNAKEVELMKTVEEGIRDYQQCQALQRQLGPLINKYQVHWRYLLTCEQQSLMCAVPLVAQTMNELTTMWQMTHQQINTIRTRLAATKTSLCAFAEVNQSVAVELSALEATRPVAEGKRLLAQMQQELANQVVLLLGQPSAATTPRPSNTGPSVSTQVPRSSGVRLPTPSPSVNNSCTGASSRQPKEAVPGTTPPCTQTRPTIDTRDEQHGTTGEGATGQSQ